MKNIQEHIELIMDEQQMIFKQSVVLEAIPSISCDGCYFEHLADDHSHYCGLVKYIRKVFNHEFVDNIAKLTTCSRSSRADNHNIIWKEI